jgi:hypothetical protein
MENGPFTKSSSNRMFELAVALAELRDSWVNMSLVLGDMLTEKNSPLRDEVVTEVERYLARLSESIR